ncbi:unnamed protein product, partial [Timema podura]|nr:unnamed protein product [Timema podura]
GFEATSPRPLGDTANEISLTTIAPLQSMMEESVLDQSSTMHDVSNEISGVSSGARRGSSCRVLATLLVPCLAMLVHVVR